jgi:starch phosphorylase
MKASANGALNLSVLDGWWDEGYTPEVGWAIGHGEVYEDQNLQDSVESRAIYDILERDAIPLYFDRGADGLPRGWVSKMKASLTQLNAQFNTNRMLREYTEKFYLPLGLRWQNYVQGEQSIIRSLAAWKLKLEAEWRNMKVVEVTDSDNAAHKVGGRKRVSALVHLGKIEPKDIVVECYYGPMDMSGNIEEGKSTVLESDGMGHDNLHKFTGYIPCDNAGLHGYAVRILPSHEHLVMQSIPGLITWG